MKPILPAVALSSALIFISCPANAGFVCFYPDCPGDAPMTNAALSQLGSAFTSMVTGLGGMLTSMQAKTTAQTQGELAKSSAAKVQAAAALGENKATAAITAKAAEIDELAKQPAALCGALLTTNKVKREEQAASIAIGQQAAMAVKRIQAGTGLHDEVRMIRAMESQPDMVAISDVGINSALLHSDSSGNTIITGQQRRAINLQIQRKLATDIGSLNKASSESTPVGMLYAERQKAMASSLSSSASAYAFILESKVPSKERK
jgi:hypothetical protein